MNPEKDHALRPYLVAIAVLVTPTFLLNLGVIIRIVSRLSDSL